MDFDDFDSKDDFIDYIHQHKSTDELINEMWELMKEIKILNAKKENWKAICEMIKEVHNAF